MPCKKRWHFHTDSNNDNDFVGQPTKTFSRVNMLVYAISEI